MRRLARPGRCTGNALDRRSSKVTRAGRANTDTGQCTPFGAGPQRTPCNASMNARIASPKVTDSAPLMRDVRLLGCGLLVGRAIAGALRDGVLAGEKQPIGEGRRGVGAQGVLAQQLCGDDGVLVCAEQVLPFLVSFDDLLGALGRVGR